MTPSETAARAILAALMTHKNFPAFWNPIDPVTQERLVERIGEIVENTFSKEENA